MKIRRQYYFYIVTVSLALITGCKSNSTGPGTSLTVVTPGPGSYFLMRNETRDSTGALVSVDTTMETVAQTGLFLYGKTNVIQLIDSKDGEPTDTGYIHFESNGDVSSYGGAQANIFNSTNGWVTVPFASQTTSTSTADTTIDLIPTHIVTTFAGAGRGSIAIKGNSFTTEKVKFTIVASSTFGGRTVSETNITTIEFAPQLGDVVIQDSPGTRDPVFGDLTDSNHDFVFDYLLK